MTVIGLETGEAETVSNDLDPAGRYKVDRTIDGTSAADYDGLVIPGGCVGADKLVASAAQRREPRSERSRPSPCCG